MQASSALLQVRQCNTHPESSRPSWPKHPANVKMLDNSHVSQESGSAVAEIVNGSRLKAHTMVDAAVKVLRRSFLNELFICLPQIWPLV